MTITKILCSAIAVVIVFAITPLCLAQERAVGILFCDTPGSRSRQDITADISQEFPSRFIDCSSFVPDPSHIFVALSYSDATAILSNPHSLSSPIIVTNVYRDAVSDLMAANERGDIYTLFNDPNPRYQLRLAKAIFKKNPRLLLIHSYATHSIAAEYKEAAISLGIELQIALALDEKGVLSTIQKHQDVDAIVLIPDKRLYNKMTLPNIINTSYRINIPLIGFSPALVKSGIVATTYPSIHLRSSFISTAIDHYIRGHDKPNIPLDENIHSISINRRVAQSLSMDVAEDQVLIDSIQPQKEGEDFGHR